MANEILTKAAATQFHYGIGGSYSPADVGTNMEEGTVTDVALTFASLGNGSARQSIKTSGGLGALFAPKYRVMISVDFTDETPTAGGQVDVYWAPSTNSTLGSGNTAGNSGADAAAGAGGLGTITEAEFLLQCQYIGSFIVHDGASVQNGFVGIFEPPGRYGQIVVVNNSGDAFEDNDVETGVFLNPIIDEIQ